MKKYLLYSSLLGIFTETLVIRAGIDLKLIYLIFFLNYLILISIKKIVIPQFLIYIILYLFASTILGFLMKTDRFLLGLQQILGIGISILYFYNFFRYLEYPVEYIFEKYVKISVWLSIIGILLFIVNIVKGNSDYRLQSLMTEPAHFAGVVSPAFYYLLKNYRKHKFGFYCVSIALVFSGSSVGFTCIFLSLIIYSKRIFVLKNALIYSSAVFLGIVAYFASENVRIRVNDTFISATSVDVTGVNWSTYALISNLFVTENVIAHNPLTGNGLGSHVLSHAKYIDDLTGKEDFEIMQELNAADAGSLTLRTLSDMGCLGVLLVILFISKFYVKEEPLYVLSRAIIVYFFYKLFRDGHYFSPEMYFFVLMYYYYYIESRKSEKVVSLSETMIF